MLNALMGLEQKWGCAKCSKKRDLMRIILRNETIETNYLYIQFFEL